MDLTATVQHRQVTEPALPPETKPGSPERESRCTPSDGQAGGPCRVGRRLVRQFAARRQEAMAMSKMWTFLLDGSTTKSTCLVASSGTECAKTR